MEKSTIKQSEKPELKAVEKPSAKKYMRMRKGSIILNIPKREFDHYKRLGYTEI